MLTVNQNSLLTFVPDLINAPVSERVEILKVMLQSLVESLPEMLGYSNVIRGLNQERDVQKAHTDVTVSCPHTFAESGVHLLLNVLLYALDCILTL